MILNHDYNNNESDLNHDTDKCHNYNLTQDDYVIMMKYYDNLKQDYS